MGQRGFLLLEYLVVLALLTWTAVWSVDHWQRQSREQQVQASLQWGLQLRQAVQDYLLLLEQLDVPELQNATDWPYQNWRQPQLQELQAAGLLSRGFPLRSGLGEMRIHILEPVHCESSVCPLDALLSLVLAPAHAWFRQAYYQSLWQQHSMGFGVQVESDGQSIKGPGGRWPNPAGVGAALLLPGTVGLSVFKPNTRERLYVRIGDNRNPQLTGAFTVKGEARTQSDLHIEGALHVHARAVPGGSCQPERALVQDTRRPGLLTCYQGMWQPLGSGSGGAYRVHSVYGCDPASPRYTQVNPVTGLCQCPVTYITMLMAEFSDGPGMSRSYICVQ